MVFWEKTNQQNNNFVQTVCVILRRKQNLGPFKENQIKLLEL